MSARDIERAVLFDPLGLSLAAVAQRLPPFTTVQNRFYAWRDRGLLSQIVCVLVMGARDAEGRQAPTAIFVDSQSVKTTEAGGPRGFDAAKKIKGPSLGSFERRG
jgi:hypothetical protein